ncbi:MAG: hypothetical protein FWD73_06560 [Polyangiaceae bacterium]|nr:hypothetical protein [Polyangiaceae bacterium]
MGDPVDLTVEILKQIRDGVFELKAEGVSLRNQVTYIHQEQILTNKRLEMTNERLESLRVELKDEIETTNKRLNVLRVEVKDDIESLRTEVKDDIESLRVEVKDDIESLRTEVKDEIGELRHTVGRVARISDETLKVSLDDSGRMDALEGRVRNLEAEMQALRPHQ